MDARGLSAAKLGKKAGVSGSTIGNWFGDPGTQPRVEQLVPVARVLGVTVEELVDGVDYPPLKHYEEEAAQAALSFVIDAIRRVANQLEERLPKQARTAKAKPIRPKDLQPHEATVLRNMPTSESHSANGRRHSSKKKKKKQ
jgi:transcriptional regulator with XRE-family HTH domain